MGGGWEGTYLQKLCVRDDITIATATAATTAATTRRPATADATTATAADATVIVIAKRCLLGALSKEHGC